MPPQRRYILPHTRLHLALRQTQILWLETLPHAETTLALLKHFPLSPPFRARIAAYNPKGSNSSAIITYPAIFHLTYGGLLIRSPNTRGLLPLSRIMQLRRGVITISNVLLQPDPKEFRAIASAVSRAASLPKPPSFSRFKICAPIAADDFSKMYDVIDNITGESLVLMLYRRPPNAEMLRYVERVITLRTVLQKARGHPFILDLRHATQTEEGFAIVVERCETDLFTLLRAEGALSEKEALGVVAQLVSALARLHEVGGWVGMFSARDVQIDEEGWIRLSGVRGCGIEWDGLAEIEDVRRGEGEEKWMDREEVDGREIAEGEADDVGGGDRRRRIATDMWGLGVLTHFMLCGEFPFEEEEVDGEFSNEEGVWRNNDVTGISSQIEGEAVRNFLGGLLNRDVDKRLGCGENGFVEIRRHAWLKGVKWKELEKRQGEGALRHSKMKDVELLDMFETDIRQTFSVPVLPEGLVTKDSRRAKFAKLFAKENKMAGSSNVNDDHIELEGSEMDSAKDGKGIDHEDEMFVFGFGFSTIGPGFSTLLGPDINREDTLVGVRGVGRRRKSSSGKGKENEGGMPVEGVRNSL